MSEKYTIHEIFVIIDTKISANSLENTLSKIYLYFLCTYVLWTYGKSYTYVRSKLTMRKIFYPLWVQDRSAI